MNFERSALRYAHTTGYTSLLYAEDCGECVIYSCGNDGDLRKWKSIDDDDPTSSCLGEFVMCIVIHDGRLLASTDRNTVQAYKIPDIENDGILMRFTAPVTCLSANSNFVAAGSEDTNIKVQKIGEDIKGEAEISFKHSGPLLSLDVSPVNPVLASIAGDGYLKIWDLETATELKSVAGLPKVNSFERASCYGTPVFEPTSGKFLAYVKDKEVCVLATSTWELQYTLLDENIRGNYTCCRFSSNGQLLAAGTTAGEISIFDFLRKQPINCEPPTSDCQSITSLCWNPQNDKELAYCDATGQLGVLYSSDSTTTADISVSIQDQGNMDFDGIEFENDDDKNGFENSELESDGLQNGNDDDDDDGVSIEKLKSSIMKAAGVNASDSEDTRESLSQSEIVKVISKKTFKQQQAFQPSSTPNKLEHRYLVWNDVGIVTAHIDNGDGSIDVDFHDVSVHHALHISNIESHDMASLSSSILALATSNSSKLVCIAFAAGGGNKEWSIQLPDCESVETVATTIKFVAVTTSAGFLRIFTIMGTQREIISIPGPVITIAGFDDRLIVCYHSSPSSESQQYVAAMLIQIRGLNLKAQTIPIPLPVGRQLSWLGFSDCGSPVFSDSMGLLQLFNLRGNCWYPICDTLKQSQSVSNNYFIISVSERQQIVQAVLCRGCTYPMTNPRPMMQELPLQMPHCDTETDKSDLESTLTRAAIMFMHNSEKHIKETAIKLFALACRSENESRAKELIETIGNPEVSMLAVKYATKLGRSHLSEKLYELMPQMQQESNNEDFVINESESISPHLQQQLNTQNNGVSLKLAPKLIELSHAKRSSLKRFSTTPTSASNKKLANISNTMELTSSLSSLNGDEMTEYAEKVKENQSEDDPLSLNHTTRSPLNSVNPFAAKRKLADADFGQKGGILLGANKLKIAKK